VGPPRVFITGASGGLGAALARHYAAAGVILGLVARRKAELERLAAALSTPCEIYPLDVRDAPGLAAAGQAFSARHGVPDVVIANAGVSVGTLTQYAEDTEVFEDVLRINLMGMVNSFQPFVAAMQARGSGRLCGIASVAGYRGLPGAAAYSASKAAAISYLESLRVELRAAGVKVVTVSPGYIATAMTQANPYPMPFMMSAETAAAKIARLIDRGKSYSVIPWQMAIVARLMHVLPDWLYDRLFVDAPRKPRREA